MLCMGALQRLTGSHRCHGYRELLPSDVGKRLLIAVYHRDFLNDNNQHLGSMSFGIRDVCQSSSAQVCARCDVCLQVLVCMCVTSLPWSICSVCPVYVFVSCRLISIKKLMHISKETDL